MGVMVFVPVPQSWIYPIIFPFPSPPQPNTPSFGDTHQTNKCQSPYLKNTLYKCKNILTWLGLHQFYMLGVGFF
jgi:hypothetical protein